jgi:uncharacterized protein (DUF1810 family)
MHYWVKRNPIAASLMRGWLGDHAPTWFRLNDVGEGPKQRRLACSKGPYMTDTDPFNLERFVSAQAAVFSTVMEELTAGQKRSHWMWFIFPQLRGLGHSSMAKFYGIGSLDEARAYLGHTLLGPRLNLCTLTVLAVEDRSLHDIFGSPDDMKFHSSMTLFALAAPNQEAVYRQALERWWQGRADERTIALLDSTPHRR